MIKITGNIANLLSARSMSAANGCGHMGRISSSFRTTTNTTSFYSVNSRRNPEIAKCIHELSHKMDKLMNTAYDRTRVERISSLITTLLHLSPHDSRIEAEEKIELPVSKSEIKNATHIEHDLQDLVAELCCISKQENKQFSNLVNRVIQLILKHDSLTNGTVETENTTYILENILHGSLGFGLKTVVKLMYYYPEIFEVKHNVIEKRLQNLRRHNLREGFLQRAVSYYPKYLMLPEERINKNIEFAISRLDFKTSELAQLFLYTPQIFVDPIKVTEDKFHYIYFTMGYKKHYVLARHGILRYSLQHIRNRHLFLERRGQYQLGDKQRRTTIVNPKFKDILCTSDANFCRNVALCFLEEFTMFKKVLQMEEGLRAKDNENENDDEQSHGFADKLLQQMS